MESSGQATAGQRTLCFRHWALRGWQLPDNRIVDGLEQRSCERARSVLVDRPEGLDSPEKGAQVLEAAVALVNRPGQFWPKVTADKFWGGLGICAHEADAALRMPIPFSKRTAKGGSSGRSP